MRREDEQKICEWCNKRKFTYACTYCGAHLCKKCTIDMIGDGYYCKSCVLSVVKSDQSCD
ncbi:MAG: hypothetical protein ACFFDN_30240 [Candidatus Hodarchaeota archaeon]